MPVSGHLRKIRARARAVPPALLVGLAIALLAAPAGVTAPGGPSGGGVQPMEVVGNQSCVDLLGAGAKELKDDSPGDGVLTDGTLSVTVDVRNTADGQVFDFTGATQGIDLVVVKGGPNANAYSYPAKRAADTGLHAPVNSSNGAFHDLSHISFCYGMPSTCTAPTITLNPQAVTTTYGDGNVQFTAAASGNPLPTVKWQISTSGAGGPWSDIPDETDGTLTITRPTVADSGKRFRAVFTNSCGFATTPDALLTVNRKVVNGAFTAANKVYDGNTSATITGRSLTTAVVPGDIVMLTGGSSTFDTKVVANGKPVTGTGFGLGGADAANYVLGTVANTTANITPKPLTGTCTVASKVYDGTTAATVTGSSLGSGVVAGDFVSLNDAAKSSAFADPNVGAAKPVPCNGFALAGADAGNYSLTMTPTTASITPKLVVVTCTAADKAFDGNTSATITGAELSGVVAGDSVAVAGGAAAFDSPDPGQGKPVTCSGFTLVGPDKDNYVLSVTHPKATIQRPPAPAPPTPNPDSKCLSRNIFAFVRGGRQVRRVVFFLDGKKFATATKPDSRLRFGIHIKRRAVGPGKHTLSATVYFTKASKRKRVSLIVFRFRQCLGSNVTKEISVTKPGRANCVRKPFLAFVRGDTISKVAFFVNGRRLRTLTVADGSGRYKLRVRPAQLRPGRNVIRAKITYIRSSKTRTITLTKAVRKCNA